MLLPALENFTQENSQKYEAWGKHYVGVSQLELRWNFKKYFSNEKF